MFQPITDNSPFPRTVMAVDAACLAVLWFDMWLMVRYLGRKRAIWGKQGHNKWGSWRLIYLVVITLESVGLLVSMIQPRCVWWWCGCRCEC